MKPAKKTATATNWKVVARPIVSDIIPIANAPSAPVPKIKPSIAPDAKPLLSGMSSWAKTTIMLCEPPLKPPAKIANAKAVAPSKIGKKK